MVIDLTPTRGTIIDDWYMRKDLMWHGTSRIHLESIISEGLKAATKPGMGATAQHDDKFDEMGAVALTDSGKHARFYALTTTVMTLKLTEDYLMIVAIKKDMLDKERLIGRMAVGDRHKVFHEYDYYGDIPPEAIECFFEWSQKYKNFVVIQEHDKNKRLKDKMNQLYKLTEEQDILNIEIIKDLNDDEDERWIPLHMIDNANAIILGISRNKAIPQSIMSEGYVEEKMDSLLGKWHTLRLKHGK